MNPIFDLPKCFLYFQGKDQRPRVIAKLEGLKKIGSPQRGGCGELSQEGLIIYSIEKFAFKEGVFSPTGTSARAESWEEIPSITLRIKRNSITTFLGDFAIALRNRAGQRTCYGILISICSFLWRISYGKVPGFTQ